VERRWKEGSGGKEEGGGLGSHGGVWGVGGWGVEAKYVGKLRGGAWW